MTGQNIRSALRAFRRNPGVSWAIVVLLTLGIGANATMFGIVDRLLLSPPPHLAEPGQLRLLYAERTTGGERRTARNLTYPDVGDIHGLPALAATAAYIPSQRWTCGIGTEAREMRVQQAEASFFTTLGVRPVLGRFYGADEDAPGAALVAVISEDFWERELGRDPAILGRVLALNRGQYEVVGVAPSGFTGVELGAVDAWLPLRASVASEHRLELLRSRTSWFVRAVVRLKPGVLDTEADAQMTAAHLAARRAHEERGGERYVESARPRLTAGSVIAARGHGRTTMASISTWLAGVSAMVLVIACANVANLLLARGVQARRERAIRMALGADRARLAAQVITEVGLLAALAAAAALVVVWWGGPFVRAILLPDMAPGPVTGPRVLLFSAVAAVIALFLTGVLPALQAGRISAADRLRSSRGASAGGSPVRGALMIGQVAFSVVLLVGAGLFVRSLLAASRTDPGFDHEHVLVATLEETPGLDRARRADLYRDALPRVAGLSGVRFAAMSSEMLVFAGSSATDGVRVSGRKPLTDLPDGGPYLYSGTEDFFSALGVPVTRGRSFEPGDLRVGAEPVGMVNETFARTVWRDSDAVGQCFKLGQADEPGEPPEPCRRVVGVFRDFARFGLADGDALAVAVPLRPRTRKINALIARVDGRPADIMPSVHRAMLGASDDVRFVKVTRLSDRFERLVQPWKRGALIFVAFGALAILVSGVGLYSLLAFWVAERRRELAIRAAVGADRRHLLLMVAVQAGRFLGAGLLLGFSIAFAFGPFLRPLLFGIPASDVTVHLVVLATLAAMGSLAAIVPAMRATSISPRTALEAE